MIGRSLRLRALPAVTASLVASATPALAAPYASTFYAPAAPLAARVSAAHSSPRPARRTAPPAQRPPPARGPAPDDDHAVIYADEMTSNSELNTVTARGGVEIYYQGRILAADTVNYSQTADRVSASGDVVITDVDGAATFAEYVDVSGDLKEGFAREAKVILSDGSHAAARAVRRLNGDRIELDKAVYSACDACAGSPSAPRLWRIRANTVTHDKTKRRILYDDAWVEIFGVPVLYTPYLAHPDSTVKRQSGFLTPSYHSSNALGVTVATPYYWAIDRRQDATLTPTVTTNEGPIAVGQYRGVFDRASLTADGSLTRDSEGRVRNHLFSKMKLAIDDTWRAGADINVASDKTYLRRYKLASPSFLTNRVYVEGFSRHSYASVESYAFQNLSTAEESIFDQPIVAPIAEASVATAADRMGAYHTVTLSAAAIHRRNDQPQSRRISAAYAWSLPYIGALGEAYTFDLGARADAYHVEDGRLNDERLYTGTAGRVVPHAAMTWSLPLERRHDTWREVIEPIVQGVISPYGQNSDKIPNEDSLDFELDDTNLFSLNRFVGWDRVESGPRVNYGIKYDAFGTALGRVGFMVGQSRRAKADGAFAESSGMSGKLSDMVGRVLMRPKANFGLLYRFRLDKETFKTERSELAADIGPPVAHVNINYLQLENQTLGAGKPKDRQEAYVAFNSAFSRYWSLGASTRYDLTEDGGPISIGAKAAYEDECFIISVNGTREYSDDDDVESGFSIGLRVAFKSLGELGTAL